MITIEELKKDKLMYQVFIGMVSEIIGFDETVKLLKGAKEAINKKQ